MKQKQDTETLYAPLTGEVIALSAVPDEVFSQRILGDGVAVRPREGVLYAPVDGQVEQVFETGHALTLISENGAELLLHIGIDTVALKGKLFEVSVAPGATVKRGEVLVRFDADGIRAAGYEVTTPMIVSNSDDYTLTTLASGAIEQGQPLLRLTRKQA